MLWSATSTTIPMTALLEPLKYSKGDLWDGSGQTILYDGICRMDALA